VFGKWLANIQREEQPKTISQSHIQLPSTNDMDETLEAMLRWKHSGNTPPRRNMKPSVHMLESSNAINIIIQGRPTLGKSKVIEDRKKIIM